MPDIEANTEIITPLPHPVLTSLCRLIADRLGADLAFITDVHHEILASHSWPLNLSIPQLASLLTADMLVLSDTTADPRFEPLAELMSGFRTGFYAAAKLKRPDGEWLGSIYLLRKAPRTFERQHHQAFMDAICLASEYLLQHQALQLAVQIEARLLPFESGVESLTDAVISYNDAGRVTYANRPAEQLFGLPATELEGKLLKELIPGGAEALPQADSESWKHGQVEGLARSGSTLYLEVASRRLQVDGRHSTLLVRDQSDRHESLHELAQSQLHTQALLQAIPDMLFVLSKSGQVLSYKPDSLPMQRDPVGRSVYHLWPINTAEQIMLYLQLTLQRGQRLQAFSIKQTLDGSGLLEAEGRITPMGSDRALLVVRNVTLDKVLAGAVSEEPSLPEAPVDPVEQDVGAAGEELSPEHDQNGRSPGEHQDQDRRN